MGNLWEDDKNLTKVFAEYRRKKLLTIKYLFLKCSDEEQSEAWPGIVSKLSMELVRKIDSVIQKIQKDCGWSEPKSNATAVTVDPLVTTTTMTTTAPMMTPATTTTLVVGMTTTPATTMTGATTTPLATTVVDLSVSPMMSSCHSNLSRMQGCMKVLTEN